jgi:hypothetical protein
MKTDGVCDNGSGTDAGQVSNPKALTKPVTCEAAFQPS